jgi:hypothetical protein
MVTHQNFIQTSSYLSMALPDGKYIEQGGRLAARSVLQDADGNHKCQKKIPGKNTTQKSKLTGAACAAKNLPTYCAHFLPTYPLNFKIPSPFGRKSSLLDVQQKSRMMIGR